MLKENGRLKPAGKIELSNLKGKNMYCPNCKEHRVVEKVEFANTKCKHCGEQLMDSATASDNKAVGK
jgi:hypothetical protein